MKKMVHMFLCLGLVLSLVGCSGNGGSDTTVTPSPLPQVSVEPTQEVSTPPTTETTEVYAFVAASLSNVMDEIATNYKVVNPNVTLIFNPDSSGTLQTQIEEGAECDLFFSAAKKQMNALAEGGFIVEGSQVELLENKVVLIKPTGGETTVTSFETIINAKNIALAGEDVPVGSYAREIFTSLGILDQVLAMEINEGANVSAVLAAVSEASNEVGVVYATDAASVADKVEVICEAPEGSLATPVIYPVGLVKNTEADEAQTKAAEEFLAYLQTEECLKLFEAYGFSINK